MTQVFSEEALERSPCPSLLTPKTAVYEEDKGMVQRTDLVVYKEEEEMQTFPSGVQLKKKN